MSEVETASMIRILLWSVGPAAVVVAGGAAWGWAKAKIVGHDKEIEGTKENLNELRKENRQEHKALLDELRRIRNGT